MRTLPCLAFIGLVLMCGCRVEDPAAPRSPLIVQDETVPQSTIIKVKTDDWEQHGTPGDDMFGYRVERNVEIITAGSIQHGAIQVFLQRSNGALSELPLLSGAGGPGGSNLRHQVHVGRVVITVDRAGEAFAAPGEMLTFKVLAYSN